MTSAFRALVLSALLLTGTPALSAEKLSWRQIIEEPLAPRLAPAGYDVTVVVFSDYRCPYCRRLHAVLGQLTAADHKVRVIYRDWPVLGAPSVLAARAAIASQYQDRYAAFNNALFALPGQLSEEGIRQAAQAAGVDWPRLQRDMRKHTEQITLLLRHSDAAARALGFEGTPGLLIGHTRNFGAPSLAELQEAVAEARTETDPPLARGGQQAPFSG